MKGSVSANWSSAEALKAELKVLMLPRKRRMRAMGQIGREIKKQARKNVKNQRNVRGESFKERRKKRTKEGQMLSGFVKGRNIRQRTKSTHVSVDFKNVQMGKMARAHQEGQVQKIRSRKMSEKQKSDWRNEPATQSQANEILRLGWGASRRKDGKRKKISRQYVMDNLTRWEALGMIAELSSNKGKSKKKSWDVKLPPRAFFPNDAQWVKKMVFDVMTKELSKGGKNGFR